MKRPKPPPRIDSSGHCCWGLWIDWRTALIIVKPETVIACHRKGFRLFQTWETRHGQAERLSVPTDVRELIGGMSRDNPLWGAPPSHGELLKLGIGIPGDQHGQVQRPHGAS